MENRELLQAMKELIEPINKRLDKMEQNQQQTNQRLDKMEQNQQQTNQRLDKIEDRLGNVEEESRRTAITVENKVAAKLQILYDNRVEVINLEKRMEKIEQVQEECLINVCVDSAKVVAQRLGKLEEDVEQLKAAK